jgi:hypothetical protein
LDIYFVFILAHLPCSVGGPESRFQRGVSEATFEKSLIPVFTFRDEVVAFAVYTGPAILMDFCLFTASRDIRCSYYIGDSDSTSGSQVLCVVLTFKTAL